MFLIELLRFKALFIVESVGGFVRFQTVQIEKGDIIHMY